MFRILVPCGKGWADPENPVPNEGRKRKSTELPVEGAAKPNSTHRYWNAYSCMTSACWLHRTQCRGYRASVAWSTWCLTIAYSHHEHVICLVACLLASGLKCSIKHLIIIRADRRSILEASTFDGLLPPFNHSTNMQTQTPAAQAKRRRWNHFSHLLLLAISCPRKTDLPSYCAQLCSFVDVTSSISFCLHCSQQELFEMPPWSRALWVNTSPGSSGNFH